MKDLIDRQEAIKALCRAGCGSGYCGESCDDVKAIENMPSADAVEVVRCKDCKWHTGCHSSQNDYCSWGERKGGLTDDHNTGKI